MIDTIPKVVKALSQIGLPVYFEHFVNSDTPIPCITYVDYDNSVNIEGNTLGYSNIVYHIKIWSKDKKEIADYSNKIDSVMREEGYTRTNTNELWLDNIGQRQMKYKGLGYEKF